MTDWLAGSLLTLTYWPTDWLTVLLADEWLASWMTDWLSEWLTYWLNCWLTDWLTIWLAFWLTEGLTCWLTDWLTDHLSEWWQMVFLRRSWADYLIVADLGCGQAGLLTIESHGVSSHCFPTHLNFNEELPQMDRPQIVCVYFIAWMRLSLFIECSTTGSELYCMQFIVWTLNMNYDRKNSAILYHADISKRYFSVCHLKIVFYFLHELKQMSRSSDVTGRH